MTNVSIWQTLVTAYRLARNKHRLKSLMRYAKKCGDAPLQFATQNYITDFSDWEEREYVRLFGPDALGEGVGDDE